MQKIIDGLDKMDKDNEKYMASVLAILAIPSLLNETDTDILRGSVPPHDKCPVFICFDQQTDFAEITSFKIFVDGQQIGQTSDFVCAMDLFIISFYVFNITHPKSLEKSLLFCDRMILICEIHLRRNGE